MLISQLAYLWFITLAAIALGLGWGTVEVVRLRRALTEDRRDPIVRDRIFGSVIGLLICGFGTVAAVLYHL